MPPRIWNRRRQWLGNLIPLGLAIAVGSVLFRCGVPIRCLAAIAVAWVGVSHWGFFENTKIDQELRAKTNADGELIGYVFKKNPTALDAHAEIGILNVSPQKLSVTSEDGIFEIPRQDIVSITRQSNIHSLLVLGGWVVVTLAHGAEFKLESRKHRTMWQSRKRTAILFEELITWKHEKAPA